VACAGWRLDLTCCTSWAQVDPALQVSIARVAVDMVWMLTGRRFQVCPVTVFPCPQPCSATPRRWAPGIGGLWYPVLRAGKMVNIAACGCGGQRCTCRTECRVRLDPGPVHPEFPVIVTIDGVALDPHAYQVVDGRWLVRIDGGCWPTCQAFDGQPGSWSAAYYHGIDPPDGALSAAAMLCCEMGKACVPNAGCRLPQRIQTIVRDGVTMVLLDKQDWIKEMLTALPEVDLQIRALNPYKLPQESVVTSPDLPSPSRITWRAT
jgi:hypothetical protein